MTSKDSALWRASQEVLAALRLASTPHPQAVLFRPWQPGKLRGIRVGKAFIYPLTAFCVSSTERNAASNRATAPK
jgi:hypothetical protein